MDRTLRLEKETIGKLLFQFSLPAITGMIVMASYNVVDRLFVGRGVGPLAISGIAITFPIIIAFMGFGMLVGVGAAAMVSIKLGEKKIQEAEIILGNAFTLSIIIALVITGLCYLFLEPLLRLLGGSGEVLTYAVDFSKIVLISAVFQSIAFTLNNIIRGEGNPKMAMATMIIGAILNIILNPIFIFGFHWGIQGSAWATVISQFVSSLWVMLYFFGKKSHVRFHYKYLKLQKEFVLKIFSIGISPFAMQIGSSIVILVFNKLLASYGGDLAIAAMGIAISVLNFVLMPVFGINQGIQPIIGYNFGAKLYPRVRRVLKLAMIAATIICTAGFFVVLIFSESIIGLFCKNDPELVNIGGRGMRILFLMLPIAGFQIVNSAYFQAVGKAKQSVMLTLNRQFLFLIPMLLIFPRFFQLDGIWFAMPASDVAASLLSLFFFYRERRIMNEAILNAVLPENS